MPCIVSCCCCDLHSGSIACGIYSMIYSALALGISAYAVHVDVIKVATLNTQEHALFIGTCVDLAFFCLLFMFSIALLYGVKNNKRQLLMPWVVCILILVALQCLVIFFIFWSCVVYSFNIMGILELAVIGLFTSLNIYCVVCVISQYQEMRDGRGDMRAMYRAQGGMLPREVNAAGKPVDVTNMDNGNFVPQVPFSGPVMTGPYPVAATDGAPPPPYMYLATQYPTPASPVAEVQKLN